MIPKRDKSTGVSDEQHKNNATWYNKSHLVARRRLCRVDGRSQIELRQRFAYLSSQPIRCVLTMNRSKYLACCRGAPPFQ